MVRLNDVIALARQGTGPEQQVLEDAAKSLGIAITTLINVYDHEGVVLGASLINAKDI